MSLCFKVVASFEILVIKPSSPYKAKLVFTFSGEKAACLIHVLESKSNSETFFLKDKVK